MNTSKAGSRWPDRELGEPTDIVLREGHPGIGKQVHLFSGWLVARGLGEVGLFNEKPECRIYLRVDGGVVIAFRDVVPDDDDEEDFNELENDTDWTFVYETEDWHHAEKWGELNAPHGCPFDEAWRTAQALRP